MLIYLYIVLMVFTAGFCFAIAYSSYRRYETSVGRSLAKLQFFLGVWSLFQGIEVFQHELFWKLFYSAISYFGVAFVGPSLYCFIQELKGKSVKPRLQLILNIYSLTLVLAAATSFFHKQLWDKLELFYEPNGFVYVDYGKGPVFWIMILSQYFFVIHALVNLLRFTKSSHDLSYMNRILLLMALLAPWVTSLSYVMGFSPLPGIDLTPLGFVVTALLVNIALENHLFDPGPMARESLVDVMSDGVIVLNQHGVIIDSNTAVVHLLERMGIFDLKIFDHIIWSEAIHLRQKITGVWTEEQDSISWSLYPLWDHESFAGTLFVVSDRSHELKIQNDLYQAKISAEQMSQAKSNFLSAMSHEIRTPLNAIIGFSRELSNHEFDHEVVEMIQNIVFSGENLLTLVNDLLDWSKIESGQMQLYCQPVHFHDLLNKVCASLEAQCREKNIYMNCAYDPNLGIHLRLRLDAIRLIQILVNLVGNAIKFTSEGGVTLRVTKQNTLSTELIVLFEVIDTGIGISHENQSKIFDRFSQADGEISRKFGGTGLGLSISSSLVELMGSKIEVESELNQGSRFYFSLNLPVVDSHHETTANSQINNFKGSVLVVDDIKMNLMVARKTLERKGLRVDTLLDAASALAQDVSVYDLIFLDLHMPETSGYEVCQIWKANGLKTPVVALTADVSDGVKQKIDEAHFDQYLSKPFREEDLNSILVKYLANAQKPK